jgi:hypothetical protein
MIVSLILNRIKSGGVLFQEYSLVCHPECNEGSPNDFRRLTEIIGDSSLTCTATRPSGRQCGASVAHTVPKRCPRFAGRMT